MTVRVLIIDDQDEFRRLLAQPRAHRIRQSLRRRVRAGRPRPPAGGLFGQRLRRRAPRRQGRARVRRRLAARPEPPQRLSADHLPDGAALAGDGGSRDPCRRTGLPVARQDRPRRAGRGAARRARAARPVLAARGARRRVRRAPRASATPPSAASATSASSPRARYRASTSPKASAPAPRSPSRCCTSRRTRARACATFDRFLREYQIAASIEHPNVARVHDFGVADDHAFIAMEYFPLGDLRGRIKQASSRCAR